MYTRWDSQHGMGNVLAPRARGRRYVIRPWPAYEAYEGKDGAVNETSFCSCFCICFFSTSHLLSAPSAPFFALSLLLIVETQIRSHIAGSSPPSPLRFVRCIFIARRFQLFLPSSTRVELCLPTLRTLSSLSFLLFWEDKFEISPRRDSNSRANTT